MNIENQLYAIPNPNGSMTQVIRAYYDLTKPKILLLLVFTSLSSAIVAERGIPEGKTIIFMLLGLALSSGGAAAVNMWYDRDIDILMKRTQNRPIPQGLVSPNSALCFGILLGILSVVILALFVNSLTALLSFVGYLYYAVFYTVLLKRKTPQNIVIGGGAGAMPILIGWASVAGSISIAPILIFFIIFFWTPPHSWALALYKNDEYSIAGIPMMPVVRGPRSTKFQSVVYCLLLFGCSFALYYTHTVSFFYLVVAIAANCLFLACTIMMYFEQDVNFVWAKRTFFYSLVYILVMFTAMII